MYDILVVQRMSASNRRELMKNKLTLLRIIETIMQVIIVPLIIVTQFAWMTNGYGDLQLVNFLDSADWADGYLAAIGMVILVVITLLFTWTPLCKWTAIPAVFEIVLIGRTIVYVSKLHSAGAPDHLGPLAVPYLVLTIAAFVVAVLMNRASSNDKPEQP